MKIKKDSRGKWIERHKGRIGRPRRMMSERDDEKCQEGETLLPGGRPKGVKPRTQKSGTRAAQPQTLRWNWLPVLNPSHCKLTRYHEPMQSAGAHCPRCHGKIDSKANFGPEFVLLTWVGSV